MKRSALALLVMSLMVIIAGCAQSDGRRWTPLQLAATPSIQMAPPSWDVYGVHLDVLGCENHDVIGVGAGLSTAAHRMDGVHVGIWELRAWRALGIQVSGLGNGATAETNGLQLAGLFNGAPAMGVEDESVADAHGDVPGPGFMRGAQAAGIYNWSRRAYGLQVAGIFNVVTGEMRGLQVALFNGTSGPALKEPAVVVSGLQVGGLGNGGKGALVQGLQVGGLFNRATRGMRGVQIGALHNKARHLSGVQIGLLNFNEGGWLPFCPLINIGFGGGEAEED